MIFRVMPMEFRLCSNGICHGLFRFFREDEDQMVDVYKCQRCRKRAFWDGNNLVENAEKTLELSVD